MERTEKDAHGLAEMTQAILSKLDGFFEVDDSVRRLFLEICTDKVSVPADTILVAQGGAYEDVLLVDSGWVMRSRNLANGSRQIVNMAIPGDFVALNAVLFDTSDFELRCKTAVDAYRFDRKALSQALHSRTDLAAALFWANSTEESMLAERIVSLGRRSARERLSHVLCEFVARLEIIGIEDIEHLVIPLTQEELADILGISIVHTNKTLRSLERAEILSFRNGLLVVRNHAMLRKEAGFEDGYLHFTKRGDRHALGSSPIIAP